MAPGLASDVSAPIATFLWPLLRGARQKDSSVRKRRENTAQKRMEWSN